MMVRTGLDRLVDSGFAEWKGRKVAIVCNQATVASDLVHILDHALRAQGEQFEIVAAFGPQHGIWGHTQDNMIEWEGYTDPATGLKFFSLYGEHRKPTPAMLEGVDLLVFDVQDVGARYYTFMWTLMLCMEACVELGIEVMVLDRPNPLGGVQVEGTVLEPEYKSFVGLRPLPMRHGLTMGELANHFQQAYYPGLNLTIHQMVGWQRTLFWDQTGLPWVPPSPNMPTSDTAMVYPGMCLLEGTKLSEGRGTTRPFEMFGAPYINGRFLSDKLNALQLPGTWFRPITYQPTFHKFVGEVCEGCFIHVTDRGQFQPVLAAVAILRQILLDYRSEFEWLEPPYEYEYIKLPIDILHGNIWLREAMEAGEPLIAMRTRMLGEIKSFEETRRHAEVYD